MSISLGTKEDATSLVNGRFVPAISTPSIIKIGHKAPQE